MDSKPPRFHWLRVRATAHPTEVMERVQQAVRTVVGDTDIELQHTVMESQYGGKVTWIEAEVTRNRAIRDCVGRLVTEAAAPCAFVRDDLDARLDDEGVLYLRLGKQAAYGGHLEAVQGDDAVQVRIRIEAHPNTPATVAAAWRAALALDQAP